MMLVNARPPTQSTGIDTASSAMRFGLKAGPSGPGWYTPIGMLAPPPPPPADDSPWSFSEPAPNPNQVSATGGHGSPLFKVG